MQAKRKERELQRERDREKQYSDSRGLGGGAHDAVKDQKEAEFELKAIREHYLGGPKEEKKKVRGL